MREGFAAHVAGNAEFHQAVKDLQRTQNPRSAEKLRERGYVDASVSAPAQPAAVAPDHSTPAETEPSAPSEPSETSQPVAEDAEPIAAETATAPRREPNALTRRDLHAPELKPSDARRRRGAGWLFWVAAAVLVALALWAANRATQDGPDASAKVPSSAPPVTVSALPTVTAPTVSTAVPSTPTVTITSEPVKTVEPIPTTTARSTTTTQVPTPTVTAKASTSGMYILEGGNQ